MDIETDCAYDMPRTVKSGGNTNTASDFDFSKLSIQDEQIDSGLSSGYFSGEFNEESSKDDLQSAIKSVSSVELESDISKLNIDCSSDRCDSGINDVYADECISSEPEISQKVKDITPLSSHFTVQQIDEIFRGDEDGDNHLHLSIIHGLKGVTHHIIGLAPDWDWLNQPNNLLQTPLHIAVITRQALTVRRLMCAGASVDIRDQLGNTPLHNACRLGYEDIVRVLLSPITFDETKLNCYSIPFQRVPQELDTLNYEGLTCLHLAAIGGHLNVMKILLSSGANVNASEGKNGRTVLHMAADWGHIDMIKFLLGRDRTNIDAFTYAGLTPVHLAFGRHNREAVQVLVRHGASTEMHFLSDDSDMENSDDEFMFDRSPSQNCIQYGVLQTCR